MSERGRGLPSREGSRDGPQASGRSTTDQVVACGELLKGGGGRSFLRGSDKPKRAKREMGCRGKKRSVDRERVITRRPIESMGEGT